MDQLKDQLQDQLQNPQELFLSTVSRLARSSPKTLFLVDKKSPDFNSTELTQVIDFFEKDLRMLSLPKESFDGIWWENASARYALEDNQRILGLLFQTLKAKTGQLAISFNEPSWTIFAVESQLKQAGLIIDHLLKSGSKVFILTHRI